MKRWMQKIYKQKLERRKRTAKLPFAEKIRIVEELEDFARHIRESGIRQKISGARPKGGRVFRIRQNV